MALDKRDTDLPGGASGCPGFRDERSELATQQLPGGSVRELADEDHRVRGLGRPKPGLGELPDFTGRQLRARPQHDKRADLLAPLLAGQARHGHLGDTWHLLDDRLDLRGRDVLTAADDRVVGAAPDKQIAGVGYVALVAGREPAAQIGDRAGLPVLAGHLRAADVDLPGLARSAEVPVGIPDLDFALRERLSDRA